MKSLIESLKIIGIKKPTSYCNMTCYQVEVKGTTYFIPIEYQNSFLLGQGGDKYKTCIGDYRYLKIENWLTENIIPNVCENSATTISSYQLKHLCEDSIGGYVNNETIKYILAMQEVPTVKSTNTYPLNIIYQISKSVIIKIYDNNRTLDQTQSAEHD